MAIDFSGMNASLLGTWGEDATYTPDGGTARTITVIADRNRANVQDLNGVDAGIRTRRPGLVVWASVDPDEATYGGIDPAGLDTGSDYINIAPRAGGPAQDMGVQSILSVDNGMIALELR